MNVHVAVVDDAYQSTLVFHNTRPLTHESWIIRQLNNSWVRENRTQENWWVRIGHKVTLPWMLEGRGPPSQRGRRADRE